MCSNSHPPGLDFKKSFERTCDISDLVCVCVCVCVCSYPRVTYSHSLAVIVSHLLPLSRLHILFSLTHTLLHSRALHISCVQLLSPLSLLLTNTYSLHLLPFPILWLLSHLLSLTHTHVLTHKFSLSLSNFLPSRSR